MISDRHTKSHAYTRCFQQTDLQSRAREFAKLYFSIFCGSHLLVVVGECPFFLMKFGLRFSSMLPLKTFFVRGDFLRGCDRLLLTMVRCNYNSIFLLTPPTAYLMSWIKLNLKFDVMELGLDLPGILKDIGA